MKIVIDINDKLFFDFSEVMKKAQTREMTFDEWIEASIENTLYHITKDDKKNILAKLTKDKKSEFELALKSLEYITENGIENYYPEYVNYLRNVIIRGEE